MIFKYVIAGNIVQEQELYMIVIVPYSGIQEFRAIQKANVHPPYNKWRVKNKHRSECLKH